MRKRPLALLCNVLLLTVIALAQEPKSGDMAGLDPSRDQSSRETSSRDMSGHDMSSRDMSGHEMSKMHDMPGTSGDASSHAMHSMEKRHMDMGPHMKMTRMRESKPGDDEKAAHVVEGARKAAAKYMDYKIALSDGYKIFLPNLPQKQYHFTNYWYAFQAGMHFNPEKPTSLLYEKDGDDYKLIGVMYTAPKNATEDELDERIPLSVAQWHAHVKMCMPPEGSKREVWGPHPKFGLNGSITTKFECDAEGGKFIPQIFGWMVHVYPFEPNPEAIWSVERQAHNHMD
jgi:hypothetical protein